MSASTTRLSLTKPGGGSTGLITPADIVDIDVLNANFDKIDAVIGAQVVTSTTLPSSPFVGQFVFETDTKRIRVYQGGVFTAPSTERGLGTNYVQATIAAVDNIADSIVGDSCYLTDPGSGNAGSGTVDPAVFTAISGSGTGTIWSLKQTLVVDTKAHLTTFIAAFAGTGLQFEVGQLVFVTALKLYYRFTSTAGAFVVVPNQMMTPTASSGAINPDGSVTFAAGAVVTVDGVFSEFTNFKIIYQCDNKVSATDIFFKLRQAGTTTGSGSYDTQRLVTSGSGTPAGAAVSAFQGFSSTTGGVIDGGAAAGSFVRSTIEIFSPAQIAPTFAVFRAIDRTATPGIWDTTGSFSYSVSAAYDGFAISPGSGNASGTIWVIGID